MMQSRSITLGRHVLHLEAEACTLWYKFSIARVHRTLTQRRFELIVSRCGGSGTERACLERSAGAADLLMEQC